MALPKEPRQKMINMMYLVLTALLALNVSSEILNAFKIVNTSLLKTNDLVSISTSTYLKSLEAKKSEPESRVKAEEWYPVAQKATELTSRIYSYIDQVKDSLMFGSGYNPAGGDSTYKEDNLDAATRILVEGELGNNLMKSLEDYKRNVLNIHPAVKAEFEKNLPIDFSVPKAAKPESPTAKEWTATYFRMTPTIAALTILSKFQNDVRTTENRIVAFAHSKVGEVAVRFDTYQPLVGASSTYLMPGQELEITAGLGAFSSQKKPTITINGAPAAIESDGMARKKFNVPGVGSHSVNVVVSYTDQEGNLRTETKKIDYTVGSPTGASVSADAVKVLYIGLDNPLTISGGNVGAEKTNASIDNGTLRNLGGGKFVANVRTPGKATINVNADGKNTAFEFRVKRVPDPTPMVGQSAGGRVQANIFKAQQGLRADLKDFVFEGVKYDIVSFVFYATGAGFPENAGVAQNPGAYFNGDSKRIMERCRPGTTVVLDEIRARGPDGEVRPLPTMAFNLY
ncbi:gliding motility protein GldM [Aridibaculum aurantiacum]|uniref:type IX secretion system motor protein PorM/GldM n=1 Tax=Aridibaculum aurantiacum TaxID=2810307 RepID=UPI001A96B241|nr:gliding motility protein GldM [Aridibaculum aurantiacum]